MALPTELTAFLTICPASKTGAHSRDIIKSVSVAVATENDSWKENPYVECEGAVWSLAPRNCWLGIWSEHILTLWIQDRQWRSTHCIRGFMDWFLFRVLSFFQVRTYFFVFFYSFSQHIEGTRNQLLEKNTLKTYRLPPTGQYSCRTC